MAAYNKTDTGVHVVHDASSNLVASFVRNDPAQVAASWYNIDSAPLIARGVLSNLADLPAAKTIDPNVQALIDQFAKYENDTSVLPFSITAAGVVYNKDLFAQHNVQVPTTWTELLAACKTFQAAGITPIYMTIRDPWTIQQGLFDYVSGGAMDVDGFFEKLKAQGADGTSAGVSFSRDFKPAVDKMLQLLPYANKDAASRAYPDGNVAFAQGKAAMYFQGPWALGEIAKINPKAKVGTFPLPASDSADDLKVRVNVGILVWIPKGISNMDEARRFASYLMSS